MFGEEFGALAEILGLTGSDGKEIQKCYIDYLEALVSYYKTARSSGDPIIGNEDLESFKSYRCDGNRDDTMDAENGKERVEHFGITLEDEGIGKHKPLAHHKEDELKIKCYKCQSAGHFDFECSSIKNQDPFATYNGASTSRPTKEEDTQSTSSGQACKSKAIIFKIYGTLVAPSSYNAIGNDRMWIKFCRVNHVTISGGTLDAQGGSLWACKSSGKPCPKGATHFSIWTSPNTDGIHLALSTGITILSSKISMGDDCVSIGPGNSNVWIEKVLCGPGNGV
nr:polygalacturonase-like [Tanacetum cinerariifolium]